MLNQVPVEAVYSATYVENYLDCVENLPDELQRLISRMRELDVYYLARVREVALQTENFKNCNVNSTKKARSFARMQQALIAAQELGDEKMNLLQAILDKIEIKTRLLDQDYKNLDFGKDDQNLTENKEQQPPVSISTTSSSASLINNERPSKRPRRTRHDTFSGLENNHNEQTTTDNSSRTQTQGSGTASGNAGQKKTAGGKKKKRKTQQRQKDDTPPPIQPSKNQHHQNDEDGADPPIDPDEPTYCLCDQISYGEMIMCDNDLCPIEWFHFSCVTLTTKPKGKWYCPKCRGERANVMKPKAQFLRELERYNKEKEEKT